MCHLPGKEDHTASGKYSAHLPWQEGTVQLLNFATGEVGWYISERNALAHVI